MSSDFNANEFRRRRASDKPQTPETAELPFDPPAPDPSAPQEYVPQAMPPQQMALIPEAVPQNPYGVAAPGPAAGQAMPSHTNAGHNTPPTIAYPVQPPAHAAGGAVPLPMPMPLPAASSAAAMPETSAPKKPSKSLIGGLLAKMKKQPSEIQEPSAPVGPVEFQTQNSHVTPEMTPQSTVQPSPLSQPALASAPLRAAIPEKASAFSDKDIYETKSGMPTWAAYALGLMSGVILTFAGLALTAKTVENSLEARFSETAEIIQSAEMINEDEAAPRDVVETAEAPEASQSSLPPI